MSQKDEILSLLKKNGKMTQSELAQAIYGDKNHTSIFMLHCNHL